MAAHDHSFVLTKIIATLGPASREVDTMVRLIEAGTRVFRINFSHGSLDEFRELLANVREASARSGRYVGVLGDLSGPKFRLGKVVEGGIQLNPGDLLEFTAEPGIVAQPTESGPIVFSVNQRGFLTEAEPGQRILLNDGAIALTVESRPDPASGQGLRLRVVVGGLISSGKGINLPDTNLTLPALTEWDEECAAFAVEEGFDFLALSFVRNAKDVTQLKDRLRQLGARPMSPKLSSGGLGPKVSSYGGGSRAFIPVIAKIEKPQALEDLGAIVDESDVIMVARGDLGVEIDLAQVPIVQRKIIETCHDYGKPVIVATQMLQSMINAPIPTRAEASDVANAILGGADCVMLSGETAVGEYPEEAVTTMRRIAKHTNTYRMDAAISFQPPARPRQSKYRTAALAHGVGVVAQDLGAKLIILWSQQGGGASYISQMRLSVPVLTFSSNVQALYRMSILYGIVPRYLDTPSSVSSFVKSVDSLILDQQWGDVGDAIVLVLGEPLGHEGLTNEIRIHYVGDTFVR